MKRLGIIALGLLAFTSCQNGPSYEDQIAAEPIPQNAEDRQSACDEVRMQLADQSSRLQMASSGALSPLYAAVAEQELNQRIAALENRAAALECNAAFSSAPPAPAPGPGEANGTGAATGTIEECISACLANTSRTRSQCFDDCNHS